MEEHLFWIVSRAAGSALIVRATLLMSLTMALAMKYPGAALPANITDRGTTPRGFSRMR